MPRTNAHQRKNNSIVQIFWGRGNYERVTAFCHFYPKGIVQKLMHELKYKNGIELGVFMGKIAASDLLESNFFDEIDLLIPVPMHPKKLKKRGFNPAEKIARGIQEITGIELDNKHLMKVENIQSQTKKGRLERWDNVSDNFKIEDSTVFEGKHICLVDDVLTTGATIEACFKALSEIKKLKISVFTFAHTY